MFDFINNWLSWYHNSSLGSATLSIPMIETMLLFLVLTICLLLRFSRTGLIVAYLFVYRWGWYCQEQDFLNDSYNRTLFITCYIIFGILIFVFAIVGMIRSRTMDE